MVRIDRDLGPTQAVLHAEVACLRRIDQVGQIDVDSTEGKDPGVWLEEPARHHGGPQIIPKMNGQKSRRGDPFPEFFVDGIELFRDRFTLPQQGDGEFVARRVAKVDAKNIQIFCFNGDVIVGKYKDARTDAGREPEKIVAPFQGYEFSGDADVGRSVGELNGSGFSGPKVKEILCPLPDLLRLRDLFYGLRGELFGSKPVSADKGY